MRVLVYGAGALGQAIGGLLAADGHQVTLLARERYADAIRREGLAITGIFGDRHIAAETITVATESASVADGTFDVIFVTVKSYDTALAAEDIRGFSDRRACVFSLQNGCGNMEVLAAALGEDRVAAGRVITGFEVERPGIVRITVHADAVHLGGYREGEILPLVERLAEAIDHAGLPCVTTPTIRCDLFAKLLYNCALNPLGAVLGVPYGALGDDPDARRIMDTVIDEVFAVIAALGASTPWDSPSAYRAVFYGSQISATRHHRSSMLQDLEQGKRTEVEALTGYVAAQGARLGIPTPVCCVLSDLVRFREHHAP